MNHPQNLHEWEGPAKIGPFILRNELKRQRLDICSALSGELEQNNAFFRGKAQMVKCSVSRLQQN